MYHIIDTALGVWNVNTNSRRNVSPPSCKDSGPARCVRDVSTVRGRPDVGEGWPNEGCQSLRRGHLFHGVPVLGD